MNYHQEVLKFLQLSNQFPDPDDLNFEATICLSIRIDAIVLMDTQINLIERILSDFNSSCKLFEEVIAGELTNITGIETKVIVRLLFDSLPRNDPKFVLQTNRDFPKLFSAEVNPPIKSLVGILVARSAASSIIKRVRYLCPNPHCPHSQQRRAMDLMLYADAYISFVQDNMNCSGCSTGLIEDLRSRHIVHCSTCLIQPNQVLESDLNLVQDFAKGQYGNLCQPVSVLVEDDWFPDLELGNLYEIFGRPTFMHPTKLTATPVLECINLKQIRSSSFMLGSLAGRVPELTPNFYRNFKKTYKESPWSFVGWMSFVFGDLLSPQGSYFPLKMSLLLSLAQLSEEECAQPLPILVACSDSLVIHRLMMFAISIANRKVIHSIQNPLSCLLRKQGQTRIIEAGSLLLASSGICFLGDLQRFQKETLYSLKTVLETEEIRVEIPANEQPSFDKGSTRVKQRLSSTSWGYYTLPSRSKEAKNKFCKNMKSIIDVFGMVLFPESFDAEDEMSLAKNLSSQILWQATENRTQSFIPDTEWKMFLLEANSRRVSMTSEAEQLLKKYFVASRKARNGFSTSTKGSPFPQGAIKALTELSKGHAKLSLRPAVTLEDAVAACFLYETNIAAQTGFAPIGQFSGMHGFEPDMSAFLTEYPSMMEKFQESLIEFVIDCSDNSVSGLWEE